MPPYSMQHLVLRFGYASPRSELARWILPVLARALFLALFIAEVAMAGDAVLDTDIAVAISAQPNNPVHAGDTITFTLSVTNTGPNPLPMSELNLYTDDIVHFFRLSPVDTDCPDIERIVENEQDIKFVYLWHAARQAAIPVGTTVRCHLRLTLLPNAPKSFSFGLGFLGIDPQPQNNRDAVTVVQGVDSVPTMGRFGALALLLGTALCAATAIDARNKKTGPHSRRR